MGRTYYRCRECRAFVTGNEYTCEYCGAILSYEPWRTTVVPPVVSTYVGLIILLGLLVTVVAALGMLIGLVPLVLVLPLSMLLIRAGSRLGRGERWAVHFLCGLLGAIVLMCCGAAFLALMDRAPADLVTAFNALFDPVPMAALVVSGLAFLAFFPPILSAFRHWDRFR